MQRLLVSDDWAGTSTTLRPADRRVLDLCAAVFQEPGRLVTTLTHGVDGPFVIAPHEHPEVLQFDLMFNCGGRAWMAGAWHPLAAATAMVAAPGQSHGYELEPGPSSGGAAWVYHFQLQLRGLPAGLAEAFLPLFTGWQKPQTLLSAMRVVTRLGAVVGVRQPILIARLAEALCLWPQARLESVPDTGQEAGPDHEQEARLAMLNEPEAYERGMARAMELIETRMAQPPSLSELAEAAHFSERHFSRRFRVLFGCTPHTYMNARRFALARQMLSQERLQVQRIAEQLGFGSVATFSRWFSQQAGCSPTAFRQNPQVM